MATSDWSIPTGKAITGATYIKDTDNNIAATIEDLRDWCNNANGTYTDWTTTGLRTDFLSVSTAQAITSVKTVDTGGAIDFTNGEFRIGGIAVTSTASELNILDGVTSSTAELNILDGVTATKTELNILDGVTSTTTELNILDGVTATTEELNILDGVTSTTAELNILDGVTATATEINKLDGVTATTEEINIVDGVTATTEEINQLAGVTLVSGLWTPTLTIALNIDSSVPYQSQYTRVGNIVTCSLHIGIDPAALGKCSIRVSLPVSTNFGDSSDLTGAGVAYNSGVSGIIPCVVELNTVDDVAEIHVEATSVAWLSIRATFVYEVI